MVVMSRDVCLRQGNLPRISSLKQKEYLNLLRPYILEL